MNNPFEEYAAFVKKVAGERKTINMVLALHDPGTAHEAFRVVTYASFFKRLRNRIGECLVNADTKYLVLLIDFMKSIEHLQSGESSC